MYVNASPVIKYNLQILYAYHEVLKYISFLDESIFYGSHIFPGLNMHIAYTSEMSLCRQ